jgi:MFS family permease
VEEANDRYKWIALSNTTFATLLATIDGSITLIALPEIFRGIELDPLDPANSFYLLWMILGFLVVVAVLVLTLGRLGDLYGRVRMYNLGFVIYTVASLLLAIDWMTGTAGAQWLIGFRLVQGVGAAFLLANTSAILTDAFPPNQRGLALGISNVSGIAGQFIGLVLGGFLAAIDWRLVFLISVPLGVAGAVWSHLKLEERGVRTPAPIDWAGNLTFAFGLISIMVGITYGIQPHGGHTMGWTSPIVVSALAGGTALLALFVVVETHIAEPMFQLALFRIQAFSFGAVSTFLASIARGGLMFMLIIWLQGIWLPQHGYGFAETPLWAAVYMLPMTFGVLAAGPISGYFSDRLGSRPFAVGGMLGMAVSFFFLIMIPIDFPYPLFAAILVALGLSMGTFASPNRAGVMNSLPAEHRGAGGGMNQTLQNSAQVLSVGVFFTLLIVGLSATLPATLSAGLEAHGVPAATAQQIGNTPPVSAVFAAFLGYNPLEHLIGPDVLAQLPVGDAHVLTGRSFFPQLITEPFRSGLHYAFVCAIAACLVAAAASLARGPRYIDGETQQELAAADGAARVG